jgi:two-component system response regulator
MAHNPLPGRDGDTPNYSEAVEHTHGFVGRPDLQPILLVEHDANHAKLTVATLAALNLVNEVIRVTDGMSAIQALFGEAGMPTAPRIPALIILDLHLPDIDGLSILRSVKSNPPLTPVPVIVLTDSPREPDRFECQRWTAHAYIEKPLTATRLAEVLRELGIASGGGMSCPDYMIVP